METLKRVNSVHLKATESRVWDVLTKPEWTEKYMYNCQIVSTLERGASLDWVGEYMGQKVHLIGEALEVKPPH